MKNGLGWDVKEDLTQMKAIDRRVGLDLSQIIVINRRDGLPLS